MTLKNYVIDAMIDELNKMVLGPGTYGADLGVVENLIEKNMLKNTV